VVSASWDKTVRLWNAGGVDAVAFSPDGKTVASASYDETVRLWNAGTGATLQTVKNCSTERLVFSREGSYLETNRGLFIHPF
jgi:uncharacterized protein with WD repeat